MTFSKIIALLNYEIRQLLVCYNYPFDLTVQVRSTTHHTVILNIFIPIKQQFFSRNLYVFKQVLHLVLIALLFTPFLRVFLHLLLRSKVTFQFSRYYIQRSYLNISRSFQFILLLIYFSKDYDKLNKTQSTVIFLLLSLVKVQFQKVSLNQGELTLLSSLVFQSGLETFASPGSRIILNSNRCVLMDSCSLISVPCFNLQNGIGYVIGFQMLFYSVLLSMHSVNDFNQSRFNTLPLTIAKRGGPKDPLRSPSQG
eukprot:TRINITY_DN991_c0_g1_i2.p1 TRINITY_DN991_c0_g1~~TRINITY_DN991_c0_g1_i2.p1  ORF type:complete len:254 (+),score=-36.53 TRINITY_DN991_c0_g1_i2:440-1201(+)